MSLQRTSRRLPAWRQQRMLATGTPRFVALSFGRGDSGASFGVLALLSMLFTLGDHALGRWFDGPPPLGPVGVVAAAGVGTVAWVAVRALLAPTLRLASAEQRRGLASAVARELEVAGQPRAEIETLSWTASRAWLHRHGVGTAVWVLECDAAIWVALRGPLVDARLEQVGEAHVGHRFTVERLRHTGAMLSLTIAGAELPVQPIELVDASGPECELWTEHELPAAFAGAIGRAVAGYR